MDNRSACSALPATACLLLLLSACSSVRVDNLWPFGDKEQDVARAPADATGYQCAGGKGFYLRYLDNRGAAWIIFPNREFRLDKANAAGTRYSNGVASLVFNGDEATLTDGSAISFTGCKAPAETK